MPAGSRAVLISAKDFNNMYMSKGLKDCGFLLYDPKALCASGVRYLDSFAHERLFGWWDAHFLNYSQGAVAKTVDDFVRDFARIGVDPVFRRYSI